MPPKKPSSVRTNKPAPLVVVPPPPKAELPGAVPLAEQVRARKRPLSARDNPAARHSRGKASRADVRREVPQRSAPRQAPAGRGGKVRGGGSGAAIRPSKAGPKGKTSRP